MLGYEFVKCMELREKLTEQIKGQIIISKQNNDITISIFGCPTCRYQVSLNNVLNNNSKVVSPYDIDELADAIYNDYKIFINNRFFYIGGM